MKQQNWNRALEAPPEPFHARVRSVLNALPEQEEMTMKKIWNAKRIAVIAAAAVMVLSIGAVAANTFGYIKNDPKNTHSLKNADAVVEVLEGEAVEGISADARFLEEYSNGFTFAGADVEGMEARNEGDPTVYRYQSVESWYERDGAKVYVEVSPLIEGLTDQLRGAPVACGDVTVYALSQDYKVVPLDYEKSPEELEAEAAGTLIFSYDDDLSQPELMEQRYVSWLEDGMRYSINHIESQVPLDELVSMAQELIES